MYNMYFTQNVLIIKELIREHLCGDAVLLLDHEEPVTVYTHHSRATMREMVDECVHTTTEGSRPRGRVLWGRTHEGDIPSCMRHGTFHPYK